MGSGVTNFCGMCLYIYTCTVWPRTTKCGMLTRVHGGDARSGSQARLFPKGGGVPVSPKFVELPTYYHCSTYLSAQPDLCLAPSCYSHLICCHPLSTTYIFFSKNHQSLISLCITSSLESTSCIIPPALHKTPCRWCHKIHLPPAHHSHPPSHIHCFIPGSKLTFSTKKTLFHHSLLAPTWTAFSDYTGPDLLCSTVFQF